MILSGSNTKLPVYLITGFLGSGKTTFLNRLLKQAGFENTLVIVNEFGSVPIDHLLVESSTETIFELSNGCLCCSIRGELVETLINLDLTRFDRIFIETTGIAEPMPIFQSLASDPQTGNSLSPEGIISVFDVQRGPQLVQEHNEAKLQVALGDLILLTRTDEEYDHQQTEDFVRTINSHAPIVDARTIQKVDDLPSGWKQPDQVRRHSHSNHSHPDHQHTAAYRSIVLETDREIPIPDLIGLLHMISSTLGPKLLRIKGIARVTGHKTPYVIQMSGPLLHEPVVAPANDGLPESTKLVVIVSGKVEGKAKEIFDAFVGDVQTDRPDRDALLQNPLSIPGI